MVTLPSSIDEEELKVVASESLIVIPLIIVILFLGVCGSPWFFPIFWVFHVNILCPCFLRVLSLVFLSVHIYLDLCTRIYTRVNRLWVVTFLTESPISTRLSGPQEPPSDQSMSRPNPKIDKGKAKMPEYEDSDGNESTHSIHSEYGGLDVPIMRTRTTKKESSTHLQAVCRLKKPLYGLK